ncbi:hypothetical protein VDG1235_2505 [Verrucomicrobiia bacterium DG1235]|nr:hypothetical protein VDG1235_2505 [Verrucomicrobiae bacterium DG1235]
MALAIVASIATAFAAETPPKFMTVQSYLTNDAGDPVGDPTPENKAMQFIVYTAEEGGESVFAESQTVTVDGGYFSAILGEGTAISGDDKHDLAAAFRSPTASDRYVEIQVDNDGEFQKLSPRLRILPNAYAFLASYANVAGSVDDDSIVAGSIDDGAVGSDAVADGSLTVDDLGINSVDSAEIVDGAVGTDEVEDGSLTVDDLGDNSVDSAEIVAGAVGSSEVANGSLTADDLGNNSVDSAEIKADAVKASEIATGAVGSDEVFNNSLTADDLAEGSVASSELAENVLLHGYWGVNKHSPISAFSAMAEHGRGQVYNYLGYDFEGNANFTVNTSGVVVGLLFSQSSDRRLKQDIEPINDVLPRLAQLEAKSYHFKASPEVGLQYGFIAQDVQEVFPEVVGESGEHLSLNYTALGVVAIEGINELNEKVDTLEAENAALRERLAALEALVQSLAE